MKPFLYTIWPFISPHVFVITLIAIFGVQISNFYAFYSTKTLNIG